MKTRLPNVYLCETEFRFDRLPSAEVWPCVIWEAGREAAKALPVQNNCSLKFSALQEFAEFPKIPWLALTERTKQAARLRLVSDHQDGAETLALVGSNCGLPCSAAAWRRVLAKNGLVVLDLGSTGRHTRAELCGLFERWLDWQASHGEGWIAQTKTPPLHGRHQPADALRAIAWSRITEACRASRQGRVALTVDGASIEVVKSVKTFTTWMHLPSSQAKRSHLKAEAKQWARWIYEGKQAP